MDTATLVRCIGTWVPSGRGSRGVHVEGQGTPFGAKWVPRAYRALPSSVYGPHFTGTKALACLFPGPASVCRIPQPQRDQAFFFFFSFFCPFPFFFLPSSPFFFKCPLFLSPVFPFKYLRIGLRALPEVSGGSQSFVTYRPPAGTVLFQGLSSVSHPLPFSGLSPQSPPSWLLRSQAHNFQEDNKKP